MDLIRDFVANHHHHIRMCVEIAILFVLIYSGLYYLRGTRGAYILAGLMVILISLTTVSDFFHLEVIGWLMRGLWAVFAGALIVIFQPELRRAFAQLGSRSFARRMKKREAINEIITAVINLANKRVGALIVFERENGMRSITSNAIALDAKLNHYLVEAIFQKGSPLHDGGVIVRDNTIVAAHCIFPLTHDMELQKTLGTRHRAAIGITEETDAVAVAVSEETGGISLACRGKLKRDVSPEKLARFLNSLLKMSGADSLQDIFEQQGDTVQRADTGGFSKSPLKK